MKKILNLLLLIAIFTISACNSTYTLDQDQLDTPIDTSSNNNNPDLYSNNFYEFTYPSQLLKLEEIGGELNTEVSLKHSVDFKHIDDCDMSDNTKMLDDISDFSMTINIESSFEDALKNNFDTVALEFYSYNTLQVQPGYIDEYTLGAWQGYLITSQVEYCGNYHYYFPITDTKTLVITRDFSDLVSNFDGTLSSVSGVIQLDQEQKLFEDILTSLVLK